MGAQQRQYIEGCLTGVGAFECITHRREREGVWSLTVYLIGGAGAAARWVGHSIRITARKAAEQR
ncbi:hypothetical protein [Kitasatospora sp. GP82]|uniref:hypothetical protein n=1 Tax=Kitasatospora sp. GP82 TaxID=3035089 RepID=UPI002476A74D|nr:hypothetical protein [Kitasatospora sp. GP82]MDH6127579.1 hypothetical protein [Kitasatospora sp. GP82]